MPPGGSPLLLKRRGQWIIEISPSSMGYCPAYFDDTYPFFGSKNQLSAMVNLDLTDPNVMTQAPAPSTITAGDQSGAVTTLIKSIMDIAVVSNQSYAIGGTKLYQISASAVTNSGIWPHTISGAGGELGEDVVYYKSNLYYFYNETGSIGDIGKYDMGVTFDDDWGSTVPTGAAALQSAPHQAINGGDDVIYFANGNFVGTIDTTTLDTQALDFATNSQVSSLTWNLDRVWIAVNRPNLSGANANQSAIYNWNGVDPSWQTDPIAINGIVGALYTKNGVVFVWWQENGTSNRYNFGYHAGIKLVPIATFSGTLPSYYQVGEYKGFLAWCSASAIYLWGATDPKAIVKAFQYCSSTYTTSGGIGSPFGNILMASYNGASNYRLETPHASTKTTVSSGKSVAFDLSAAGIKAVIESIHVNTDPLATGAKCDFTLNYDKAKNSITSGTGLTQIAYDANNNTTKWKVLAKDLDVEDFRLDWSFANGSTVNPVKIRSIQIKGHYVYDL